VQKKLANKTNVTSKKSKKLLMGVKGSTCQFSRMQNKVSPTRKRPKQFNTKELTISRQSIALSQSQTHEGTTVNTQVRPTDI
jgi:hypothetical protein